MAFIIVLLLVGGVAVGLRIRRAAEEDVMSRSAEVEVRLSAARAAQRISIAAYQLPQEMHGIARPFANESRDET